MKVRTKEPYNKKLIRKYLKHFRIKASMWLCFGFVLGRVLVMGSYQQCSRPFFAPHSSPPVGKLDVHKELGRDTVSISDPK